MIERLLKGIAAGVAAVLILILLYIIPAPQSSVRKSTRPDIVHMRNATVRLMDPMTGGWGSGVIVADDVILTAKHVAVMMGKAGMTVQTADGEEFIATQAVFDEDNDLAVIFCDMNEPAIAEIKSLEDVYLGDEVYLTGTPLYRDFFLTVTKGIISAKGDTDTDKIRIDAWGAPGDSGGPVYHGGKVVALCVAGPTRSGASQVICESVTDLDIPILRLLIGE